MVKILTLALVLCCAYAAVFEIDFIDSTKIVAEFGESPHEVLFHTENYQSGGACKSNALVCVKTDETYELKTGDKAFGFNPSNTGWACSDYLTYFSNSTIQFIGKQQDLYWSADGIAFTEDEETESDDANLKSRRSTKYIFDEESFAHTNFPTGKEVEYFGCFQVDRHAHLYDPIIMTDLEMLKIKIDPETESVKNLLSE
ncbi:unnamed protein product [Moneuplotes crassus]|uniref:Uncharacterized protein n=1 Tax=Euplotes crassus TaxID=5936 RepID=A0AAD1XYL1_EUPCR|nr:unnamed protein product [Moneuplotes crassus]